MKKEEWIDLNNNFVLDRDQYFISYNPNTNSSSGGRVYNNLVPAIGRLFGVELESDGRAETALVERKKTGNTFRILNGDFRKQYEDLKTFQECVDFYEKNKEEHGSNWSTQI